jgi:hypothetical protein
VLHPGVQVSKALLFTPVNITKYIHLAGIKGAVKAVGTDAVVHVISPLKTSHEFSRIFTNY